MLPRGRIEGTIVVRPGGKQERLRMSAMNELQVTEDGRYVSGDVPFGYALWGERLVEVPAELDACVTAIRMVKQGRDFGAIAGEVRAEHGVEMSQRQFDGLMQSVYRRYGPI
jgi:hypothetical protein